MILDMQFAEPLKNLFGSSKRLVLDVGQIPPDLSEAENIKLYFEKLSAQGLDPKLPENRQKFNDELIKSSGSKYLIGSYGEDKSAMLEGSEIAVQGRTIHMGLDIFASNLEPVYSPCDGEIVRTGYEEQAHGYGYYLIIKPSSTRDLYVFFGHLDKELPPAGKVKRGNKIAQLGDYKNNENGGWSRHLHFQMMTELPPEGQTPIGYSSKADLEANSQKYPDPKNYFSDWTYWNDIIFRGRFFKRVMPYNFLYFR